MILIDTSAWIDFFRGKDPISDMVEVSLKNNTAAICGPIFTELVRGFRSQKEKNQILPLFTGCHFLDQPDSLWEDAGQCGYQLKRKGANVKSMDLLIACYALAHGVPILTSDKDFFLMKKSGMSITPLPS